MGFGLLLHTSGLHNLCRVCAPAVAAVAAAIAAAAAAAAIAAAVAAAVAAASHVVPRVR